MAEGMYRILKERKEAIEAAKLGMPTPGRGSPAKGDTIVEGDWEEVVERR
jgi:hypothetical protein